MAKNEQEPMMKIPATIVGVDFAKDGHDEVTLVVVADTPHGRVHSIITRQNSAGPDEQITPEAWEKAIKEYIERENIPMLNKLGKK
jgi:hypothetical protein